MPTSAIGRPSELRLRSASLRQPRPRDWQRALASSRGFTLIEIMIVLVIVAAMAALLVFSFNDSPQQRLRREGNGFAALLNAAADEAVMRGIELGVVLDDEGYRFVVFDPETRQWQAAVAQGLAAHKFPERYAIDFELDGSAVDQQAIERIKLLAQRTDDESLRPSILILSSGEITPFTLTLRPAAQADASAAAISLRCDGLNPVVLDPDPATPGFDAATQDRS